MLINGIKVEPEMEKKESVASFIARGGKIQQVPRGASGLKEWEPPKHRKGGRWHNNPKAKIQGGYD